MSTVQKEWKKLEEIRALRPIIEENRLIADGLARMAPAVLEATRAAGVYTLTAPKAFGGADISFPELIAIYEELGYSDPTIGWHAGNSTGITGMAYVLDEETANEVFADGPGPFGFAGVPVGKATQVEGGYILNGTWPFMTGALDAPWADLNGIVMDGEAPRMVNDAPEVRGFIVRASDIRVSGNWSQASAMRGTGSHSVSVDDLFVPNARTMPGFARPETLKIDSDIAHLPFGAIGQIIVAPLVVGLARKALEDCTKTVATKTSRFDNSNYRDSLNMQRNVAAATTALDTLSAGLQAMATDVWDKTVARNMDDRTVGRMWGSFVYAIDQTRHVMSDLMTLASSAVYGCRNPIETSLRDIHAISASMEVARPAQEAYGRVLLGVPHGMPLYFQ